MANNKYRYYVVLDNDIVSDEFKTFENSIPTFLHKLKNTNFKSFIAIIKTMAKEDIQNISIKSDKDYYILCKFGSENGTLKGPVNEKDFLLEAEKTLNTYKGNHCKCFEVFKTSSKESLKLFKKF